SSDIRLFADDTTLFITVDNNHQETSRQLNNDMSNIQKWADQWLVQFSPSKTNLCLSLLKNSVTCHSIH
ncbi:hypothetical protein, partial [Acinetobacter baumannii]|uniref:hypothetical protein n=1 Tax=Acinetobacter baumannii TaxID=470 RepID=UPI001C0668FB